MQKDNSPAIAKNTDLAGHTPMMQHHRRDPLFAGLIGRHSTIWRRFGGDFRTSFLRIDLTGPLGLR